MVKKYHNNGIMILILKISMDIQLNIIYSKEIKLYLMNGKQLQHILKFNKVLKWINYFKINLWNQNYKIHLYSKVIKIIKRR